MKKTRAKTYTGGANAERSAILKFVRTKRTKLFRRGAAESVLDQWDDLILWIGQRNERYNKRPGGVGK